MPPEIWVQVQSRRITTNDNILTIRRPQVHSIEQLAFWLAYSAVITFYEQKTAIPETNRGPRWYTSINELLLKRFIDRIADHNLIALTISVFPQEADLVKASKGDHYIYRRNR
jgi:hypothetical protein